MRKDGYWLGGSSYGYGYPMVGYQTPGTVNAPGAGYRNVRPGYEVRTLLAAANILARHGQAQPCEDVLATTRDVYKTYVSEMRSGKLPMADTTHWRQIKSLPPCRSQMRQPPFVPTNCSAPTCATLKTTLWAASMIS